MSFSSVATQRNPVRNVDVHQRHCDTRQHTFYLQRVVSSRGIYLGWRMEESPRTGGNKSKILKMNYPVVAYICVWKCLHGLETVKLAV